MNDRVEWRERVKDIRVGGTTRCWWYPDAPLVTTEKMVAVALGVQEFYDGQKKKKKDQVNSYFKILISILFLSLFIVTFRLFYILFSDR